MYKVCFVVTLPRIVLNKRQPNGSTINHMGAQKTIENYFFPSCSILIFFFSKEGLLRFLSWRIAIDILPEDPILNHIFYISSALPPQFINAQPLMCHKNCIDTK